MEVLRKAFSHELDPAVSAYVNCVADDASLVEVDIAGSLAHSRMLARCGLISKDAADGIASGLEDIAASFADGSWQLRPEFEDVHMNVEKQLEKAIGADALRLHTARSRNDQVSFDLRGYVCRSIKENSRLITLVQLILIDLAQKHESVFMPGYTHLQRAQPVALAHALLAFVNMLERDKMRFQDASGRADVCPLGAGALSGTALPIDPAVTAYLAGFATAFNNSLDAVSDRDFIAEYLSACAIAAIHLSQLAETFIIWATSEFSFVTFSDAVTTGSSLMPNKKNPDPLEIARAKSGTICGDLLNVLMVLKSLPLGYNRDLQESKPPLIRSTQALQNTLEVIAVVLTNTSFSADKMLAAAADPFLIATDLVEDLIKKGVAMRTAHDQIAQLLSFCRDQDISPLQLSVSQLQEFAPHIDEETLLLFDARRSADAKNSPGGTGSLPVKQALEYFKQKLAGSFSEPVKPVGGEKLL